MGHGISFYENPTALVAPVECDAATQVVIGRAPINLLDNPEGAVNVPLLCNSFAEAVQKCGYSEDFDNFEINQSIFETFKNFNVAPIIFINVLDPTKDAHITKVQAKEFTIEDGKIKLNEQGILLKSIVVQSIVEDGEPTVYKVEEDYVTAFDDDGKVVIALAEGDTFKGVTKLSVKYNKLNPSGVTASDIVGGYNATTNKYKGIELLSQIFPVLNKVPSLVTAPGFSSDPIVYSALKAKTKGLNGVFKNINICDVPTDECKTYDSVNAWKNQNSFTDTHTYLGWPMVKHGDKKVYASVHASAQLAQTIADEPNGVPYISPSNNDAGITGTCLKDGTEVYLDQLQANTLNDCGVFTYLNWQGWKLWGNNMACYPSNSDPKDRFISSRNVFNWWGNTFILTHFPQVDKPMNRRNIDRILTTENIRANGFVANEEIAAARMEFVETNNPATDIIGGKIKFKQYLTPYPPMQEIINEAEYDVDALMEALFGGN